MKIRFDSSQKLYYVPDETELTASSFIDFFQQASLLARDEDAVLSSVKVGDLRLEYYDNCLSNYCKQTIDLGVQHKDTCWVRNCENVVSLGPKPFCEGNIQLLYPKSWQNGVIYRVVRSSFLRRVRFDADGWAFLRFLPPLDFSIKGLFGRARYWFVTAVGLRARDRVLDVVESIQKNGWCNSLAIKPHPSVLIYHRSTGKISVHTGRHRIAAVRYLYDVGEVRAGLSLSAVLISVPWGPFRTGRPFPGVVRCENCKG